jgi:elongation factor P hydroxylase
MTDGVAFHPRPAGLTLEKIIERFAATGRLTQLSVVKSGDRYQANLQRHDNRAAFSVSVKPTALEALFDVLKPFPYQTWEDHLALDESGDDDYDGMDLV